MKWPFFKNTKSDSATLTPVLTTPPRPVSTPTAANGLKKTQMISVTEPPPPTTGSATIDLPLASFAAQLPPELLAPNAAQQIAQTTIAFPSDLLLPQLARGKVVVTVGELIGLLPAQLLASALPPGMDQHTINLPIGEIVAAIPSDAFTIQGEAAIDLNSPEFDKLPKLFDDTFAEKDAPVPVEEIVPDDLPVFTEKQAPVIPLPVAAVKAPKPEPAKAAAPAVVPQPQPIPVPVPARQMSAPAPAPTPAPVETVTGNLPSHIFVRLRSLVAVLPDEIFTVPRADLWQQADPETQIPLPVDQILPLLSTGRVRIRIATAVQAIPPALRVTTIPETDETIPLPLEEVVRQIPPALFSVGARQEPATLEVAETDIPNPFQERHATPPAPVAPAPVPAPVTASFPPEPVAPVTPTPEPVAAVAVPEPEPVQPPVEETLAVVVEEPVAASETPVAPTAEAPTEPAFDEGRFLVNLNRCTVEDLTRLDGVGPALARRIIAFRDQRGHIGSLQELREIPGIGRKTFRAIAGASPETLNRLLGVTHDRELSLQEVVRLTAALPGIEGSILTASDGLFLTGHLPEHLDADRLSVFAPQMFKKVGRYARELRVGNVNRISLFTDDQPVSIFQAGAIYLIVVHDAQHFSKALLRRLTRISEELARLCRQRAVV